MTLTRTIKESATRASLAHLSGLKDSRPVALRTNAELARLAMRTAGRKAA